MKEFGEMVFGAAAIFGPIIALAGLLSASAGMLLLGVVLALVGWGGASHKVDEEKRKRERPPMTLEEALKKHGQR